MRQRRWQVKQLSATAVDVSITGYLTGCFFSSLLIAVYKTPADYLCENAA
jgi:hypothetical protein